MFENELIRRQLNFPKINIPENLTSEQIKALTLAKEYGLENEVIYDMFNLGLSPVDALYDWDILC